MKDNGKKIPVYARPIFTNIILLVLNVFLFIFKMIFGFMTRSIALQADAFDSITDVVMVITGLVGIIFATKKPNERFPYGYYKTENIVSLIIALLIFYTAYDIIMNSIQAIQGFFLGIPREILVSPEVFIFLFISLGFSIFLTIFLKISGKKSQSVIIQSEANEKIFDNLISLSVIVNFVCAFFRLFIFDAIFGIIISFFIIKGGYDIFKISTKTLLDAVVKYDRRVELEDYFRKVPLIKSLKSVQIRGYGKYVVIEAEFTLRRDLPLSQIEKFKAQLEREIKKEFPSVFKVIMLIRAQSKKLVRIAVPLRNNQGRESDVSGHFGESSHFAIFEIRDGTLVNLTIFENPYMNEKRQKGILVSEWLISQKIDKIYVKESLKKAPNLIFNSRFTEIVQCDVKKLKDIILKEIELSIQDR
ncbi:MAG: cation diffusion facilitator family transporter [Candidatus Helarchaeota archaeon]